MSELFTLVFLLALVVSTLVQLWLATRQIRSVQQHRGQVPGVFAGKISLESHQKAADYTTARQRLGLIEICFDACVLLGFTLLGGLQWVSDVARKLPMPELLQQVSIVLAVMLIQMLLSLPFSLYRQFKIEQDFGFNRMTLGLFFMDMVKGIALGALFGIPLLALVLWLMQSAGGLWWLWAWAALMGFQLLMLWLYPAVIAPLFNKFEPLQDMTVKERIEQLAQRCGFALTGLFVMDGSKRSAHGNAYFSGFGRAKRIVFFDTLISKLNVDEIEAVLAHELGHFKLKHIPKMIAMSALNMLIFFALLGWIITQPWFYRGLGVEPFVNGSNHGVALVLMMMATPVFTFLLTPLSSALSRKHEFEADAYATANTPREHLASALVKLFDDNAGTLTPDPLHSKFYDSHPPAPIRLARILGQT